MGKTKTKIIDDSIPEEPKKAPKKESHSVKTSRDKEDSLVAKLNAELGIEKPSKDEDTVASADQSLSEQGESVADEPVLTESQDASLTGENDSIKSNKKSDQASQTEKEIAMSPSASRNDKKQKPGRTKPRSKKYQEAAKDLDRSQTYPIPEAIDMVKKMSYAKFNDKINGTLEAHINTAQTGLRGLVSLPFAAGRKLRIAVFGDTARDSGADVFGDDETIEEIIKGKVDFDILVTTADWMPKLARAAKVLGPKGLMPNPKNGTISSNKEGLKKAVEGFQSGKTEYRTEAKAPVIHISLGKLNQPTDELTANAKILLQTLGKSKIKKVSLAPTMGPSVKVNLSNI